MLKHQLIHPQINRVIGAAGHHGKILIADGNYPCSSAIGPNAEVISLALQPGSPTVTQVLAAILTAVPIEAAHTMDYERTGTYALTEEPPVWEEYRQTMDAAGLSLPLSPIEKWSFYDTVGTSDHVLTIQTGDQRLYANLLLSIGVRSAELSPPAPGNSPE